MATIHGLPFQLISGDELHCLIDNDTITNNYYLSLAVLDTMIFNPVQLQQDDKTNNMEPLLHNPLNSEHKSSQYVHIRDYKTTIGSR